MFKKIVSLLFTQPDLDSRAVGEVGVDKVVDKLLIETNKILEDIKLNKI